MTITYYATAHPYELLLSNEEAFLKRAIEDDLRVICLAEKYHFNPEDKWYSEVKAYEITADGYRKGGQTILGKHIRGEAVHGANLVWKSKYLKCRSFILYDRTLNGGLIAWIDPQNTCEVIDGRLTIQWHEQGIIRSLNLK